MSEPSRTGAGFWSDREWQQRNRWCERCDGTGWIDSDPRGLYLTACPDCRPLTAAHVSPAKKR